MPRSRRTPPPSLSPFTLRLSRQHPPPDALGDCIHLLSLLARLLLRQPMVELHQQPLSEGLPGPVDAPVVEDFGVLPADAYRGSRLAVQVCRVALLPLQSHPAKGCAACQEGSRGWTPNGTGLRASPQYPAKPSPAAQPRLTVHAGEVRLAKDSGYPELLGIHVRAHQRVAGWHLDHGFQLTAHPVGLRDTTPSSAQPLHLPLLLGGTGAAFFPQLQHAGRVLPMPLNFAVKVKTGFNARVGHYPLGYSPWAPPAWKKGSLEKDRKPCFSVFSSFHQILKLRSLC